MPETGSFGILFSGHHDGLDVGDDLAEVGGLDLRTGEQGAAGDLIARCSKGGAAKGEGLCIRHVAAGSVVGEVERNVGDLNSGPRVFLATVEAGVES